MMFNTLFIRIAYNVKRLTHAFVYFDGQTGELINIVSKVVKLAGLRPMSLIARTLVDNIQLTMERIKYSMNRQIHDSTTTVGVFIRQRGSLNSVTFSLFYIVC